MTREFQVGDKVFSTAYGILEVIEVDYGNVFTGLNPRCIFTLDGKANYKCKYPGIYHLDEALKLFPMWLEEVEEIDTEIRYGLFNTTNKKWFTDETLESPEIDNPPFKWVQIHIPTKRKIIREKQWPLVVNGVEQWVGVICE